MQQHINGFTDYYLTDMLNALILTKLLKNTRIHTSHTELPLMWEPSAPCDAEINSRFFKIVLLHCRALFIQRPSDFMSTDAKRDQAMTFVCLCVNQLSTPHRSDLVIKRGLLDDFLMGCV